MCDDRDYSQAAKGYHQAAVAAGVPAITTAGIYPGVSNLMAAQLVLLNCEQETTPAALRYSYYTAGSGGAGPTILATSFLLLGEAALAYKDGVEVSLPPYSSCRHVDFGKGIGRKAVYLLNLPEVASAHSVLGLPTVSARFGTDPPFWNWAMQAMAAFIPQHILRDRNKVGALVQVSDPFVRQVDKWAGEKVAMRVRECGGGHGALSGGRWAVGAERGQGGGGVQVDLECSDGRRATSIYSHPSLSKSVGQCTAAFALAMLEGSTQPGVWFPEQVRRTCLHSPLWRNVSGRWKGHVAGGGRPVGGAGEAAEASSGGDNAVHGEQVSDSRREHSLARSRTHSRSVLWWGGAARHGEWTRYQSSSGLGSTWTDAPKCLDHWLYTSIWMGSTYCRLHCPQLNHIFCLKLGLVKADL